MALYSSIAKTGKAEYHVKGSKFIAEVFRCQNIADFEERLHELKVLHPQAVHHCYAYRVGLTSPVERSNDDGEPSGTAGKPIMNQLYSAKLHNVAVIVVRYFGGTLLGSSNLIKAYKTAAMESINAAVFEEVEPQAIIEFTCNLDKSYDLFARLKKNEVKIRQQHLAEQCSIQVQIPLSQFVAWQQYCQESNIELTSISKE